MGFTKLHLWWCVLILGALTYPSMEGMIIPDKPFAWSNTGHMHQNMNHRPLKPTTFFSHPVESKRYTVTEVEQSTPKVVLDSRYIINVQRRCKENERLINDKCRYTLQRR